MAVLGGALVTVMLVGVIVARAGRSDSGPDGNTSAPVAEPRRGLSISYRAGCGRCAGSSIDEAQVLAIKVVGRTGEVVAAGFISRRELIEKFTTRSFGPTFADETGRAIEAAMLIELGSREVDLADLVVREQPITSTAAATADGVQVRVWSVLIIANAGYWPWPSGAWRTVTLDMVQHDGVWLVDGWSSSPGPTPSPPNGRDRRLGRNRGGSVVVGPGWSGLTCGPSESAGLVRRRRRWRRRLGVGQGDPEGGSTPGSPMACCC